MFDFIKRRLKNEKGAMDSILVTLLLVIVAVAAVVGLKSWSTDKVNAVKNSASTSINSAIDDANGS